MGDRAQVHFVDTDVWLYTHWRGRGLPETVRQALAEEARWNDPHYLVRIVFDQMTGDDTSTSGYGIGTTQAGDVYRVVHVDCENRTVTVGSKEYTFEEYVNASPEW